jgi:acetyl/propionyl-CoA carboxylase alpha subunit
VESPQRVERVTARAGTLIVRLDEDTYRAEVSGEGEVRVDGLTGAWRAERQADGSWLVISGDERRQVFVAGTGPRRQVFVDGDIYELEVETGARPRRASARPSVDSLTVPMPARVVKLLVRPGQRVRRGEVVVTLEAMKMNLPLASPRDGTVQSVACREGDLVQPGVSLLEIA